MTLSDQRRRCICKCIRIKIGQLEQFLSLVFEGKTEIKCNIFLDPRYIIKVFSHCMSTSTQNGIEVF